MKDERVCRVVYEGAETGLALPQRLFGALTVRNVAPDPAIAHEASSLVKDGQPRHGHVALAAFGGRPRELEIAERQVRVKRLPVLAPAFFVRLQIGHLPARLADFRDRMVSQRVSELLSDEAMLRVRFPVHLKGELHQGPKALLALA